MGETPSEFYFNSDVAFLHFRLKQDTVTAGQLFNASVTYNTEEEDADRIMVSKTVSNSYYVVATESFTESTYETGASSLSYGSNGNQTVSFTVGDQWSFTDTTSVHGADNGNTVFNLTGAWAESWTSCESGSAVNGGVPTLASTTNCVTMLNSASGNVPPGVNYEEVTQTGTAFTDATNLEVSTFTAPPQGLGGAIHPGTGSGPPGNFTPGEPVNLLQLAGEQVTRNLMKETYYFDEIHPNIGNANLIEGYQGVWQPRPFPLGYLRLSPGGGGGGGGGGSGGSGSGGSGSGGGGGGGGQPVERFTPRFDDGTENGFVSEEFARVQDLTAIAIQSPIVVQADPESRAEVQVALPVMARTEPPGGYESPFWAGVGGFFSGAWDGANIVADTFTFGTIAPLHQHVEQMVEENGGAYRIAQVAATISREATMTLVTMGVGAVGSCAGRATYGAAAFYAAKGAQAAFVARDAYQTYQSGQATVAAWKKGDVWGVITNGAFTLLGAAGTVGSIKALGKACFAAGTPLLTPDGSRPIEQFQVGDFVLSRDENDPEGPVEARQVLNVFQTYSPLLDLHVGGQVIRTTAEHPFWVVGRGWIEAQQIEPGDELLGHDGSETPVRSVDGPKESAPVYNLEIEEYPSYLVGRATWGFSVWSHNAKAYTGAGDELAPTNASKQLAKQGEDLYVGTYNQVRRDNIKSGLNATHTPHHAVQDAVSNTSHGRGITINLNKDLHKMTRTFGNPNVEVGLTLRQHLGRDVTDIKNILSGAGYDRSVINTQLRELIAQNKALGGFGK